MSKSITALAAALLLALGSGFACAGDTNRSHNNGFASLEDLADESGLNIRDVQMLLGARTAHAQYLSSYERKRRQFIRAVGEDRYAALVQAVQDNRMASTDQRSRRLVTIRSVAVVSN
jgi:hypothetical protein